ncbi:hypothetical protein Q9966_008175 [Columba livia]|nr:hypothetical protein Q9966_008175 [Columba livia]
MTAQYEVQQEQDLLEDRKERVKENNDALNIHSENSHRSQSSLGMRDHYCDCNFGNSSLKIQKGSK